MNNVFARIKNRGKPLFVKVLSDQNLYDNIDIDIDSCIIYDPNYNLDEDAWFKVENFSKEEFCIDFLKSDFDSKAYNAIEKSQFEKIAYLFAVQNGNFYFQRISKALFMKKKMIALGDIVKMEENASRIAINKNPDAIYLKKSDALVFRNLTAIYTIFNGIDQLYKEATKEEVETFLNNSFIKLKDNFNVGKVSKSNRKRIALVSENIRKIDEIGKEKLILYISEYNEKEKLEYNSKNKCFEIEDDKQLTRLLFGIMERYYKTPISNEKWCANSAKKA